MGADFQSGGSLNEQVRRREHLTCREPALFAGKRHPPPVVGGPNWCAFSPKVSTGCPCISESSWYWAVRYQAPPGVLEFIPWTSGRTWQMFSVISLWMFTWYHWIGHSAWCGVEVLASSIIGVLMAFYTVQSAGFFYHWRLDSFLHWLQPLAWPYIFDCAEPIFKTKFPN